ncbi:hypothetical protein D7X48_10755 [bacterium D16-50]|nr:hypothetical protein D7X48_10755 [bacterium D16-50]
MKIRHFYCFDTKASTNMHSDALDRNNWEVLRAYEDGGAFSLERTREDYIKNCEGSQSYKETAQKISHIVQKNKWNTVVSLGVGKAVLEYQLKKMSPQLTIECTDFTKQSLDMLGKMFVECDRFSVFDIANDDFSVYRDMDAVIMHRISTEFTRTQWKAIFHKMHDAGIKNVLFIPTELLTIKSAIKEKLHYVANIIRHKKNIFCGWMYTRNEFLNFFRGNDKNHPLYEITHSVRYGNTEMFELKIIK